MLLRRSVRYLLVSRGFRLVEAVVVLAALTFVLTGSRIAAIDRLGNRADIVASIVVTALAIALLRAVNRRVMVAIDRRFFREAYNAQVILSELGEAIRNTVGVERLPELVAARITDALHPEYVTIFLADEATGELVPSCTSGSDSAGTGAGIFLLGVLCALLGRADRRLREYLDRTAYRYGSIALTIVMLVVHYDSARVVALHRFAEVSIGIAAGPALTMLWPERQPQAIAQSAAAER